MTTLFLLTNIGIVIASRLMRYFDKNSVFYGYIIGTRITVSVPSFIRVNNKTVDLLDDRKC